MKDLERIAEQTFNQQTNRAEQEVAKEIKVLLSSLSLALINDVSSLRLFQEFSIKIQEIISSSLYKSYIQAYTQTAINFNLPIDKRALEVAARRVVEEPWLQRTFRKSVQQNVGILWNRYNDLLTQATAQGIDPKTLTKEVAEILNIGYNDAVRLIRTESTYRINQAQKTVYESKGYIRYRYMATKDNRTSKECAANNGKVFFFSEAEVGVNFPPLHPNCRSTIVPVIEGLDKL